jgi:acylphosphatase
VIVHGQVQGVGFRYALARRADAAAVAGWARNKADGTLEAVLEGEAAAVDSLVRFCEQGPRGAHVRNVEVHEEEPEQLAGFDVG